MSGADGMWLASGSQLVASVRLLSPTPRFGFSQSETEPKNLVFYKVPGDADARFENPWDRKPEKEVLPLPPKASFMVFSQQHQIYSGIGKLCSD